jgi:hypothetical protein
MKARNRIRLEALEQVWPAPRPKLVPTLLVNRFDEGSPNEWAEIDGKRMTPQEANKIIRKHYRRAKRVGTGGRRAVIEVHLPDLSREEPQAARHADHEGDDEDAEDKHSK